MTQIRTFSRAALALALLALLWAGPAAASHPCSSPLILDLGDDHLQTSGLEHAVRFDIDANGEADTIGWVGLGGLDPFLWLDLNHNGTVDDGSELFGTATILPSGKRAQSGFHALAVYDRPGAGGNSDGLISSDDLVWPHLRLWHDLNHDGRSQPEEISTLAAHGVVLLVVEPERTRLYDGHGNLWAFRGSFVRQVEREGQTFHQLQDVWDVFFVIREHEPVDAVE